MKRRPAGTGAISATDPIDVAFGAFDINSYRVPYMAAVMRFQQVAEYLDLVTDDPKYARQNWTVKELFQREVDRSRVMDIESRYLSPESERPQFFNSLTVVLSPRDLDEGEEWLPPGEFGEYKFNPSIGPVRLAFDQADTEACPEAGSFGVVGWNRSQVYAIAIDGQHRLAAIKEFWDKHPKAASSSSVSVILLILDECVGLRTPGDFDSIKLMRSIFIDLNKFAVPVSRVRQLLLDDLDPTACFVRNLFSSSLLYEPTKVESDAGFKVGKEGEFLTRLPLELVDWHSDAKSKIERGPYVTSVLSLEWIVRRLLKANHPPNKAIPSFFGMNPDEEGYYDEIEATLSTWKASWRSVLKSRFEESKANELPFSLTASDVELLGTEFSELWGRPMTRLLTATRPYSEVVEQRLNHHTLTPEFGQWYQARAAKEAAEKQPIRIKEHYAEHFNNVKTELKAHGAPLGAFNDTVEQVDKLKDNGILFFLVGQRALVLSLIDLVSSRKAPEWSELAGIDLEPFNENLQDFYAYYLVEAINAVTEKETKKRRVLWKDASADRLTEETKAISNAFWAGSLVRREDPEQMDFSDAAAGRGSRWFTLMSHLYWFVKRNPEVTTAKRLRKLITDRQELHELSLGAELLESCGRVLGSSDGSDLYRAPMTFLANMLEEWNPTVQKEAFYDRLIHLARLLGLR